MLINTKKAIVFFLAAAIQILFTVSGFTEPTVIYDNPKPVDFGEERVLTYSDSGKIDVPVYINSAKEIAVVVDTSKKYEINPFNYALFSDSDMDIQGSSIKVIGDVHANGNIKAKQSTLNVEGILESVGTVLTQGDTGKTVIKEHVPNIDLPDFSDFIKNDKEKMRLITIDSKLSNKGEICTSGVYLGYDSSTNTIKFTGNTFNWYSDNTVLYFNGNVDFTNGLNFSGKKQYIIAEGNIIIEGNICNGDETCIYSKNGSITIKPSNSCIDGVIYAPKGKVTYNTTGNKVNGCVVAKEIGNATNSFDVVHPKSDSDLVKQIGHYVDEYYLAKAKDFMKRLLDMVRADGVKMSIISYSDSANQINGNSQNDFSLYDTKSESGYTSLKNIISNNLKASNDDKSNMGDGLRKAYYILKGSPSSVPKYMIVLAYNNPNTWSATDNTIKNALVNSGEAYYLGDRTGDMPAAYARAMGFKVKSDSAVKIKTIFGCYSTDGTLSSLNEIAKISGSDEVTPGDYYYKFSPDPTKLAGALKGMTNTLYSIAQFNDITFEITLPDNVQAIGYSTDNVSWLAAPDPKKIVINLKADLLGSMDPDSGMWTYLYKDVKLSLKVQFLTPPEYSYGYYPKNNVQFTGAKNTYYVNYTDPSTSLGHEASYVSTFPCITCTVEHIIDVN